MTTTPDRELEGRVRAIEEKLLRVEGVLATYIEENRTFNGRLLPKLESLIEAKSGWEERDRTLVRDVDSAHGKIRTLSERQDRMEKRQLATYWLLVGAMTVIDLLVKGLPSGWLEAFKP